MRGLLSPWQSWSVLLILSTTIVCQTLSLVTAAPSSPKPKAERLAPPPSVEFAGVWTDGNAIVTIRRLNDGFRVQWNREFALPDLGVGMRHGNALYVGYHTLNQVGPGIVRYELQDGKLVGTYLNPDAKQGSETLERSK
jgi:hypothetical protein